MIREDALVKFFGNSNTTDDHIKLRLLKLKSVILSVKRKMVYKISYPEDAADDLLFGDHLDSMLAGGSGSKKRKHSATERKPKEKETQVEPGTETALPSESDDSLVQNVDLAKNKTNNSSSAETPESVADMDQSEPVVLANQATQVVVEQSGSDVGLEGNIVIQKNKPQVVPSAETSKTEVAVDQSEPEILINQPVQVVVEEVDVGLEQNVRFGE